MKKLSVNKTSSKGFAIAKAYKYEKVILSPQSYDVFNFEDEIKKYNLAVEQVSLDLQKLEQKNEIFAGHLELVRDVALLDELTNKIKNGQNVQIALKNTINEFVLMFESMDDEYMRQRADDIKDVYQRLLSKLQEVELKDLSSISSKVVVIAKDLAPSDTATMNLENVLGFATELGGVTSHVSIMARNLNLPALVGVNSLMNEVKDGDIIIIDAKKGDIYINPDDETIKDFEKKKNDFEEKEKNLKEDAKKDAITLDGKKVFVYSNVGSIEDVKNATKHYIDGIGLFRSEFLYMENTHFPTEDEQFEAYKQAAILCENKEVIIRTLDIGGDKALSYYKFEKEENPFLGFRAIRISLELKDMFKQQLRALLRASSYGYISIMYPMIISIEELLEANKILDECKKELDIENIPYKKDIKVGMMIETPATVIQAENFAKYVDFFSIGTNDLTQYLLAVDRGNDKIADMYNSFNPAVLHSIQQVIDAGHKQNIIVGMCGEFASDERACKMLLGMGLDEFSVAFTQVANIKSIVRSSNYEECKKIAEKIRYANSLKEVNEILDEI